MSEIPAYPEKGQQKSAELTGRQALLQEIGYKLSQSRTTSGESIEQAVRKLKIRKSHLQALENGNWDKMPDDIYILGFLRQYSQYLDVDLSDEIHRLKNDQYELTKPLTFPDPPVAPSRRWAWMAGVAFVLLFILFNVTTETRHLNNNDIAESPELAATAEPATGNTSSSLQATDHSKTAADSSQAIRPTPSEEPAVEVLPAKTLADSSPAKGSIINTSPAVDLATTQTPATEKSAPGRQVAAEIIPATDSELAAVSNKPKTAAVQTQTVNTAMHHFRFDAVGAPVWLQISRPDQAGTGKGILIKEVLLQPGFHTTIHAQTESLWITCGNAPALRITVDGSVFAAPGSLGTGKKVLRDYRFSIGRDN